MAQKATRKQKESWPKRGHGSRRRHGPKGDKEAEGAMACKGKQKQKEPCPKTGQGSRSHGPKGDMEAEGASSECTASSEMRKQGELRAVETNCPLASAHPTNVVKWIMGMLAEAGD